MCARLVLQRLATARNAVDHAFSLRYAPSVLHEAGATSLDGSSVATPQARAVRGAVAEIRAGIVGDDNALDHAESVCAS
jgi:hypothetical protein